MSVVSNSVSQTQHWASKLARKLKRGDTLLLKANLGAGKTTFVQGLVKALGVADCAVSPTFVVAQTYEAKIPVHHLDFYRLTKKEILDFGLQDYFLGQGEIEKGIVVVEWAERCPELWPKEYLELEIFHRRKPTERKITARGVGQRYKELEKFFK